MIIKVDKSYKQLEKGKYELVKARQLKMYFGRSPFTHHFGKSKCQLDLDTRLLLGVSCTWFLTLDTTLSVQIISQLLLLQKDILKP